ncbi:anthrax toxin receptor-like [Equus przewalskii]|uniref:Anthrax toxin receptor-like n=1 Tax=Equus przewalskii TaxID=9798 RepID=A0ABM2ENG5_EQUPR|nr:PREDICTED: anthrax toxin receptor-like [Equus przewalskii]
MGASGPGVLGPALFLLLLPPLSANSFLLSLQRSRDWRGLGLPWGSPRRPRRLGPDQERFHHIRGPTPLPQERRAGEKPKSCQSTVDLYFILDMSGSVDNNWMDIYNFVDRVVKKFENPKLRMSFITYSTRGHTLMNLTSDRNEIHDGLDRLQNVVPSGDTNMQEGFKKANEQIQQVYSKDREAASLIIALTDGPLLPSSFNKTKDEAANSQKMGASIYCVGVSNYKKDQLLEIADRPDHMFGVDRGFKGLRNIVNSLTSKCCMEITAVEPSSFCTGETYEVKISGKGFNNAKNKDEVICRFKFSNTELFDKKATSVEDTTIICPEVKIEKPGQEITTEVSLNNAISFINNDVRISSKDCVSARGETRDMLPDAVPDDLPDAVPDSQPDAEPDTLPDAEPDTLPDASPDQPPYHPPPPPHFIPNFNPFYLVALIPALLMFPVLIWCIWQLCYKKTVKEPPPVQKAEKEPEDKICCVRTCPTVFVPCGCQSSGIYRMEGKLDTLCNFAQNCNQVPLMWCQPRDKDRCMNFTLVKPPCGQLSCGPKICLAPSQECFSLHSCCSRCQHPQAICSRPASRMLPMIPPHAQALCRTTLSHPPP